MALDEETVARIARLARIDVPETDRAHLAGELSHILGWIEQLAEVDTDDVEPMRSVMELNRPWRHDTVNDGDRQGDVTANAPEDQNGYFVVPKVVE